MNRPDSTQSARPVNESSPRNSSPADRFLAELERHGGHPQPRGPREWRGTCPVHGGSAGDLLVVEATDGTCVVSCRSGCNPESIASAVGLGLDDLLPKTWMAGTGGVR